MASRGVGGGEGRRFADRQRAGRALVDGATAALVVGVLLATATAGVVVAGLLASPAATAGGVLKEGRGPDEASIEVFVMPATWTPAEGQPFELGGGAGGRVISWKELKEPENRDVAPFGQGVAGTSVARIVTLLGIPRARLAGIVISNTREVVVAHKKEAVPNGLTAPDEGEGGIELAVGEQLSFNGEEALGGGALEAPYLEAEGAAAGASAISFVTPAGDPQAGRLESGVHGVLRLTLKIDAALLDISSIEFSPTEPTAGTPVQFVTPELSGGVGEVASYTYRWNFGDGATSTEAAPKHTYQPDANGGTAHYEVSVEVTAWSAAGQELGFGTSSVSLPVNTTQTAHPQAPHSQAAHPPRQRHSAATPAGPTGPTGVTRPPRHVTGPGTYRQGLGAATGRGGGGSSFPAAGKTRRGGGGSGGAGAGGTGRARTGPHASDAGPPHLRARGRAPSAIEKRAAAPSRQPGGLVGVLVDSLGATLPGGVLAGGSVALRVTHAAVAGAGPLGALGLAAGIAAVVLVVLLGAFRELRMLRAVR